MGENADSFCAAAKIIPDRASVCTQELMWLHNCCDGAKLSGADLESRALHIGYFGPCFDAVSTPVRGRNIAEVNK